MWNSTPAGSGTPSGVRHFLARTAADAGMSCGLKNGGSIINEVINVTQFSVNEQCVQYSECETYQPFIKQNKPVFHIEYTEKDPAPKSFVAKSCNNAQAKGFSTLVKHLSLNAWTTTCPQQEQAQAQQAAQSGSMGMASPAKASGLGLALFGVIACYYLGLIS